MEKIEKLKDLKTRLETEGNINTVEYIKCLANIIYFTSKNKHDMSNIKLFFLLGIEKVYGNIRTEISDEINTALDLIFKGDFKGYCLLTAVIETLEKIKEWYYE